MTERRYRLLVRRHHSADSLVSLDELARLCGCHPELVGRFARYGLIDPVDGSSPTLLFSHSCVPRLRRALRLRQDFGLNTSSLHLVLDLIDRIEELEAKLGR